MDSGSLRRLKDRLQSEAERLTNEIAVLDSAQRESLSEASGENVYRDHMADQGSATLERELDMSLEENVRNVLTSLLDALVRIESGTYGVCERCSKPIPVERLDAMPTASLCIVCKEAEESR